MPRIAGVKALARSALRALEEQAWDLRRKGWTIERVAQELGRPRRTVASMLERVELRALARMDRGVALVKIRQTAQLEHVYEEALGAWERSKEPSRSVSTRRNGTVGPDGQEALSTVEESERRDGEPLFLDRALAALEAIRRIWGAEAPVKAQLDARVLSRRLDELSDDELLQIASRGRRAQGGVGDSPPQRHLGASGAAAGEGTAPASPTAPGAAQANQNTL